MNNRIVFITSNSDFFGQTRKAWVSMDADRIQSRLVNNGFNVDRYMHHEVANLKDRINNSIIFYTFSQKKNIRYFLHDIIHSLDDSCNLIVPGYDLLKCHENKGYQELYKKILGINGLAYHYFSGFDDLTNYDLSFPLVFKTIEGSNATGVKLVKNRFELESIVKKQTIISFADKIDIFRRRHLRKKKHHREYPEYTNQKDIEEYIPYITQNSSFILQEFVPGLDFDYRVLAIHDKYYIIKRHVKSGDFRASGAKKFDSNFEIAESLLNYASSIHHKMDTPFLSMDICPYKGDYVLFEFQALHFGINVYMKSQEYYFREGECWKKRAFTPDIENDIADGLSAFINMKNQGKA